MAPAMAREGVVWVRDLVSGSFVDLEILRIWGLGVDDVIDEEDMIMLLAFNMAIVAIVVVAAIIIKK